MPAFKYYLFSLLLLIITCTSAQNSIESEWMMVFDGYNTTDFADMVVDNDANTYVAINYSMELKIPELSATLPPGKHVARALVKINASGKAEWVRALESDFDGRTQAMALCPNGDILFGGFCDGVNSFPSKNGTIYLGFPKPTNQYHRPQFVFLARYTPKGDCVWAKNWNQSWGETGGISVNSKGEIFWSIFHQGTLKEGKNIIDSLGNNQNGTKRCGIYKLDRNGKILDKLPLNYLSENVAAHKIEVDLEDNILVYGIFKRRIDLDENDSLTNDGYYESSDAFIAKYDKDLKLMWSRKIGGRNSQEITDVQIDQNGKIWLVGQYSMECIISGGININQKSAYEWKSGTSFLYASFYPDGVLDFVKYHQANGYTSSNIGKTVALAPNGLIYISGTFNDTLQFDSIQAPIICPKNLHSAYLSVWNRDSLVHIQSDVKVEQSWYYISSMGISDERLVMGGGYYGKCEWITPKGKVFKMTHKDYGRSSFVVGSPLPQIPLNESTDSIKPRKNHLEEIEELLVCLKPGTQLPDDVWFPLNNVNPSDSFTSSPRIPSSIEEPCGLKLEQAEALVYPNPTEGFSKLVVRGFAGMMKIEVISEGGSLLSSHSTELKEDSMELDLDLRHVASGTYFVVVTQHGYRKSIRLMKI